MSCVVCSNQTKPAPAYSYVWYKVQQMYLTPNPSN